MPRWAEPRGIHTVISCCPVESPRSKVNYKGACSYALFCALPVCSVILSVVLSVITFLKLLRLAIYGYNAALPLSSRIRVKLKRKLWLFVTRR